MLNIFLIVLGFALLIKGADILVNSSSSIARKFKISEFVIGLTIVSIGTSLPELVVSIESAYKGYHNLLVGNIVGSCLYNLLLVLGIISILRPINIKIKEQSDIILMLFSILIIGLFGNMYGVINRTEGILLILLFGILVISTLHEKGEAQKTNESSIIKSLIALSFGIILLKYGGDFVVNSASAIARKFSISEKLIGTTIVALGTSLPELATALLAVKKDSTQLAVGSLIGSNIFNLLLVFGITSILEPITFSAIYNADLIFLALITLTIILLSIKSGKEEIGKKTGIMLIIFFILYNVKNFF